MLIELLISFVLCNIVPNMGLIVLFFCDRSIFRVKLFTGNCLLFSEEKL
jgi:hypothetical protein